jgi:CRP-like cAMP-binding protein
LQQQQHQQQQQKHAATRALSTQKVWRGVHKGNYVRVKLPKQLLSSSSSSFAAAFSPMLLPSVMIVPPSWPSNWRGKAAAMVNAATHPSQWSTWWSRFQAWWSQHWGTVAMNIGSVCTLIGFTRTDVLELRAFSLTGSVGAIFYNMAQMPVRYPPILWSATFAAVNATKIWQIMQERGAAVHLTAFEEETYNQFFLPHGVTPKQFESIYHKATLLKINKDDCIIKKDDKLDQVYLIIEGTTKANIRGRHLTAASFSMDSRDTKQGGASGAWIGEMSFLESLWIREQQKRTQQQKEAAVDERPTMEGSGETNAKPTANVAKEASPPSVISTKKTGTDVPIEGEAQKKPTEPTAAAKRVAPGAMVRPTPKASLALYTIVAKEECQVLRWTYDEMEELLAKSTDLRGAMTRAMTQAIVGKKFPSNLQDDVFVCYSLISDINFFQVR